MDKEFERLEKLLNKARNEIVSLHQTSGFILSDLKPIKQVIQSCCSRSELEQEKEDCSQGYLKIAAEMARLEFERNQLLSINIENSKKIESLVEEFAYFEEELGLIKDVAMSCSEELYSFKSVSVEDVRHALQNMKKNLQDQLDAFPKQNPIDKEEIEKELYEKLRPAKDDAEMARNKSITNQSRIHRLEKQLALLLEKLGISL